jgi:hypothetical protein
MNLFKVFTAMWEAKGGGKIHHPTSTAYHDGTVSGGELRGLRKLSRLVFRDPVEVIPATPFTVGPQTGDFVDGVIPADYVERRVKKAAAKASAEADGQHYIGGFDSGLHPGD